MMRLAATALVLVIVQSTQTFAGGFREGLTQDLPAAGAIETGYDRTRGPSLSASEIAAIQYHEPEVSSRCQTRAGVFAVSPLRPVDTTCVVNGMPGVMLP